MNEEPRRWPYVAIAIALANVAAFAWEVSAGASAVSPEATWMLAHGGNYGPVTLGGEPWRLATSMFLHYGVLHLLLNMVGLLDGGRHVERMYGHAGFATLYVVSGLVGSLASAVRAEAVSAGASGAVFGVFGAFAAFLWLHRKRLDREVVAKQARGLVIFLAYNLWFGLTAEGIDMVAHAGGFVAGFAVGIALEAGTGHEPSTLRRSLLVALVGMAVVLGGVLAAGKPPDAIGSLQRFAEVEEKVLARWNELVPQVEAGTIEDAKLAEIIETELLVPWRAAHEAYEQDAAGDMKTDMLAYIAAREEGWTIIAQGLRAQDASTIERGMTRFRQADAVVELLKSRKK